MKKLINWTLWVKYRILVFKTLRRFYKFGILESWSISLSFKENFDPSWSQDPTEDTHEEMQYWTE